MDITDPRSAFYIGSPWENIYREREESKRREEEAAASIRAKMERDAMAKTVQKKGK